MKHGQTRASGVERGVGISRHRNSKATHQKPKKTSRNLAHLARMEYYNAARLATLKLVGNGNTGRRADASTSTATRHFQRSAAPRPPVGRQLVQSFLETLECTRRVMEPPPPRGGGGGRGDTREYSNGDDCARWKPRL